MTGERAAFVVGTLTMAPNEEHIGLSLLVEVLPRLGRRVSVSFLLAFQSFDIRSSARFDQLMLSLVAELLLRVMWRW